MTQSEGETIESPQVGDPAADEPGFSRFGEGSNFLRIAVAVTLLGLVVIALAGILIDYRARVVRSAAAEAAKSAAARPVTPAKPATSTPSTAPKPKPAAGGTLVVLIDGVNFRQDPSGSAKILSTLNQGEKLTVIEHSGNWYHAAMSDGTRGWLTDSSQYVKRQ